MQITQHLNSSFYFGIYRDILKNIKKAGHNMLCPLYFLLKISEGKIGTANPPLFANVKKFELTFTESTFYLLQCGSVLHFLKINFIQETKTAHNDLGICPHICIRFGLIIPDYLPPTPGLYSRRRYKLFWFIRPGKHSSYINACFQPRRVVR